MMGARGAPRGPGEPKADGERAIRLVPHDVAAFLLNRPLAISRPRVEQLASALLRHQEGIPVTAFFDLFQDDEDRERPFELLEGGIARIQVRGILSRKRRFWSFLFGGRSYDQILDQLEAALDDAAAKVVLFEVDSHGGEADALPDLVDAIYAARGRKPMFSIVNESAFSAAYWIASAADRVFLSRTGGVGSVGVIAEHVSWAKWNERVGVEFTPVFAGERKNDFSQEEPLSDEARTILQAEVDRIYDIFVGAVARQRGLSEDAVRATEAGIFYGPQAVEARFADAVGSYRESFDRIAQAAASTTRSGVFGSRTSAGGRMGTIMPTKKKSATNLGTVLTELIANKASGSKKDSLLVTSDLAKAAGIEASELEAVLAGSPDRQDPERLEAFAAALDVEPFELFAAGWADGHKYELPKASGGPAECSNCKGADLDGLVKKAIDEALGKRKAWEQDVINRCGAVRRPDLAAAIIGDEVPEEQLGDRITDELAKGGGPDFSAHISPTGQDGAESFLVKDAERRAKEARH